MAQENDWWKTGATAADAAKPADEWWKQGVTSVDPKRSLTDYARDVAATAVKGAIAVPEAIVGLADIQTGGRVGKFLENEGGAVGFRPKQAKELVNDWHSDATKEAQRKFQAADGIVDKTVTAIQNPSLIATAVGESLPSMGLGGVAARGLMTATKLGQMGAKGARLASGAGEGLVMGGSAAEQIRQETPDGLLTPGQSALAAATAVVGGGFGVLGGKVASRLGIGDVDTMIAQGAKGMADEASAAAARTASNPLVLQQAAKGIPRRVIEGAIAEGFLEELPQSVAEQVFQNVALGKDWLQDVDAAAVMGVLSGGLMGGAASGYHGMRQPAAGADTAALAADQGQPDPQAPGEVPAMPNPGMESVRQAFADKLAELQMQEQGEQLGPQTTPPDGAAILAQQQAETAARRQAAQESSRAVAEPDDEILQSTGADAPPSVRMGIDPAAGPLSAGAAMAVDTGVSGQMQQAAAQAQAAERAAKESKKPAADDQKQERQTQAQQALDPETGEILQGSSMAAWSDGDLSSAFRGAQSRDVRMQLALQAELDAEQSGTVPGAERADAAFASLNEDAGPVPAELSIPATTQGVTDGPQASQAQQDRAQPAQVGATPAVAGEAPDVQGSAGAQGAVATTGVADGRPSTANPGAQGTAAPGAQAQPQSGKTEALRQQLRDVEAKILKAAPEALGQGGGDIEAAMKSRKVPVTLKAQRKKLASQIQAAHADEVQTFAPETGTLGIPRADMPQVPAQSHGGLVKHLNAQGIAHETTTVNAADLKPTQAEYSPAKVEAAKTATGDRAVIVSSDGHVIDGHHQAMAAAEDDKPVKAIVLDAPVEQALEAVKKSPSAQGATQDAPPAAAAPAVKKPRGVLAKKAEAEAKARADYFTPGNIVKSYGGHDRVVSYTPPDADGRWSVTVRAVRVQDGKVVDAPNVRERTHATPPDARELKAGPVMRAVPQPPTAESAFPESSEAASTETMDLRKLARADEQPGDIMLGNDKFVTLAQAMAAAKAEMEPEAWGKPFQFNRVLDIAPRDWNRMVQAMTGREYRDPTKGGTTDSERVRGTQPDAKALKAGPVARGSSIDAQDATKTITEPGEQDAGTASAGGAGQLEGGDVAQPAPAVRADGAGNEAAQTEAQDGRNAFTLKRMNQVTGKMEPVTFERGEYVRHKLGHGEIDGISQARSEFRVDGVWQPFGFAYKAERPAAPERKDVAPLSKVIDKMNAKHGAGLTDADRVPAPSTTPKTDAHAATMQAVRDGKATPERFQESFDAVVANADAIKAELSTKTKAELLRVGGPFVQMRYANEKKADVVDAVYREMVGEYALGESVTYGMGRDSFQNAVRKLVEAADADKLAQYVTDRQAAAEEAQASRAARAEALENPKTLEDFRNLLNAHIRTGKTRKEAFLMLAPERRIKYDTLEAESTREARETRKRTQKTQVRAAGQTTAGEIVATKHTRDGYDLFVVKLADRLNADDYKTVLASAKKLGGWYSAFRGNGAIPGFQFKDKTNAEAFLALAGGDTTAAREQVAQRRDAFEDDRSQTAVERLRAMADKMEAQAQEVEGRDRKANTERRARFASAALQAAAADKAKAQTMRNIAQAIEDGNAKFLDEVRTKSQVDMLTGTVDAAKGAELRAKYPNYADQEKRKGEPPTAETADFADFPSYSAFRSDLATLGRQMLEVDGTKKLGQRLLSVADDVTDAYLDFAKANFRDVSQFGRGDSLADFASKDEAERAIKRSGLTGKAIVLPIKRGQNRVILSPGEAIGRGVWKGDGDKRITLTAEFGAEMVEAIGRRGNKQNQLSVPWQFQTAYDRRKALARIGIETPSEFRAALREFIDLQEQAVANRTRAMELQMVGRKADGLDFFPTSAEVADQMIEAADLAPDMAVLEPSAGMGHLADRIREAGAEPDVIEISSERRALLEEKGYTTQNVDDFLELKPREFYTFGDTFRAPDGAEGIMRGSNGDRVRLVDASGEMVGAGFYSRSDLTGIAHNGTASGYDRIIMNPPFNSRRDAEHVRHAFDLLKPGGRIVAIMGEGVFFGQDKKAQDFRDWLESVGGTSEKLPEGSFMDPSLPVNTGVSARMVVIDKPAGKEATFSQGLLSPNASGPKPTPEQVQRLVDKVQQVAKQAIPVTVAGSPSDVVGVEVPIGAKPSGALIDGRIYLFSDNLGSIGDAYVTLFHEIFHLGLQRVLPAEDYAAVLRQFARNPLVARYVTQWKNSPEGVQKATAMPSAAYEALANEEALAMVSEALSVDGIGTRPMPGLARRMLSWFADVAERLGLGSNFGNWVRGLTRTDAEKFVSDMTRAVLGGHENLKRARAQYGTTAAELSEQTRLSAVPADAKHQPAEAGRTTAPVGKSAAATPQSSPGFNVDSFLATMGRSAAATRAAGATDRAIMDMAREGKTAQDILRLVAGTSKSRFNRQVARLLLRTGISPTVTLADADLGSGDGFKFLAKYSRKADAVTLTPGAESQAEHIVLHEMIHAATLRALDRKGLASLQMRRLYEHVKRQGGAAGEYGMKNVGEFVAEVFTNPEFQHVLRQMDAPAGGTLKSAWDSFVRILRSILGLPQDGHDALSRALELGVQVMREDMALRARGGAGRGADAFMADALRGLVQAARANGNDNSTVVLGKLSAKEVALLQREGVSVEEGFSHAADMFAVRHALNRHGDAQTEAKQGQLAIGEADIAQIPQIVAAPDALLLGAKTPRGQDIVGSLKRMPDGTVLYLEEVRSGRKTLAMTSMRKYPGTTDFETIKDRVVPSYAHSDTGDVRIVRPDATGSQSDADVAHFGVAERMGDAVKSVTVQSIKNAASYKKADWLGMGLQALGRRQITEIYGDDLPGLKAYNQLAAQMEADKNEVGAESDQLAQRWGKLKDEKQLAELMHDATLAQIDPDKEYVEGDDKAQFQALKRRFAALSAEAQAVYRDARRAYSDHHAKVRTAIRERIERSEIKGERKAALLERMDDEFFQKTKGVYFPLARFGQYVVAVRGPDGKIASVNRAETMGEAQALRASLVKAFPPSSGHTVIRPTLSKEFIASRDSVSRGFMTELYEVLDKQDMDAAQRAELEDTLGQLYLSSLPDLSWAKHGIHRKGTPGFSQDARRAFAQNMFHGGRYLAKLRYSDLMQDELNAMQEHVDTWKEAEDIDQPSLQRVVDEMNKRHESAMNPKSNPISTALTSFGFIFHLGLSPASAMVNLSQTALVAYPVMGAKWGYDKSAGALLRASKEAAKGKNDITGSLNADERAAYDEAVRAGTIDVTMAHDLTGIAQGEDAGVMWKLRPVMRWASFMFHHAERFNRQVTFVAAYRLARETGASHEVAFEQATEATYKGHFDYSAGNRPRIMQGNVAKVLLLFKQYGQNMVYTLARSAQQSIKGETPEARREARRVLSGLLVMHGMAAGALGLPMFTTLLAAASMIGGGDDEPWDAKVALQNMLADAFGQKPAEVLMHGLSRLTPWDISGRVGLDKLILPDIQEGLEGQRLGEAVATAALGPVAGIGLSALKGLQTMGGGDWTRGLEEMMPVVARNGLKALRYGSEGAQDKTGITILDEVNPAELAGQFLGFSPSRVRNASEGKSAILAYDGELNRRRSHLTKQFAMAQMAGDQDGVKEVREAIAKFNEKNPTRRITVPQLMQSVRARQRRIDQAEDGVYLPRNRRDAMSAGRFAEVD